MGNSRNENGRPARCHCQRSGRTLIPLVRLKGDEVHDYNVIKAIHRDRMAQFERDADRHRLARLATDADRNGMAMPSLAWVVRSVLRLRKAKPHGLYRGLSTASDPELGKDAGNVVAGGLLGNE
jgi:hypothetical protein